MEAGPVGLHGNAGARNLAAPKVPASPTHSRQLASCGGILRPHLVDFRVACIFKLMMNFGEAETGKFLMRAGPKGNRLLYDLLTMISELGVFL
jgi:hypothetical protein